MNITSFFTAQKEDKVCIVSNDKSWTYAEVHAWMHAACMRLLEAGCSPGSVIALSFEDSFRSLICQLAVANMGATVLSIPLKTPPARIREMTERCKAGFVATDVEGLAYVGLQTIRLDFDDRAAAPPVGSKDFQVQNPSAPWIIVSGSGSTGKPKLMPVTHAQQLARMRAGHDWLPYAAEDRFASLVHLDFYTTKQRYLEAFSKGSSVYLRSDTDPPLFDLAASGRFSVLFGMVFHAERLLQQLQAGSPSSLEKLTALLIGGSTVSMALREKIMSRLCSRLYVLYGTNEAYTFCVTKPAEVLQLPGNVGRPHPGFALEVVDEHERPLLAGQTGQVRIRSEAVIDGYLDDAAATAAAFREGWFYPRDLGQLTADGQVIHLGRTDDLMIMNGINIYPLEIEHVMTSHPAVAEAIALPLKHPVHQDIPACAVVLKQGVEESLSSLQKYAFERLGSYSPRHVFIADQFPRSGQGKVMRKELARMLEERLAAETAQRNVRLQESLQAMLHPVSTLDVDLVLSGKIDLAQLDEWLVRGMGISAADLSAAPNEPNASGAAAAGSLLARILLLARAFLNIAKLPVFDVPTIVKLQVHARDPRKFRARVSFALVHNMPPTVYQIAVKASLDLFQWMVANPLNDVNRETLYATIQKKVITSLDRLIPGGKSTLPVLRVAHSLGIPFIHLGMGAYQLGWGSKARRMDRSTIDLDTAIGAKLSQNKVVAANLLRMAGLPAPTHLVVGKEAEAVAAAGQIGYPVVVKPSDRDRGEGVTVDIRNQVELVDAFRHAHKLAGNKQVIVERQVDGVCHRLFIAEGRLLYAVKRLPMSVEGDGVRSVARLVEDELKQQHDAPPWQRTEIRPIDALAIDAMREKGFAPESVPAKGVLVPLRKIESTEWGGVDEDVSKRIHPDNLAVAIRAAELFGLHVAGIDIITPDISVPWHGNGAIVNEVNFAPLFGGGAISRSRIPDFFNALIGGDGKIPVEVFDGTNAIGQARARHAALCAGLRCWLTSATNTLDHRGQSVIMPLRTVEERVLALLCRPDVDALVLVMPAQS